jgi:hypothetical protein
VVNGWQPLTLVKGKNGKTGGSFPWLVIFIGGGEGEVRGGPLESASDAGIELDRRASGVRFPLPPGH